MYGLDFETVPSITFPPISIILKFTGSVFGVEI